MKSIICCMLAVVFIGIAFTIFAMFAGTPMVYAGLLSMLIAAIFAICGLEGAKKWDIPAKVTRFIEED